MRSVSILGRRLLLLLGLQLSGCSCEDSSGPSTDGGIECEPTCAKGEVCCSLTGTCEADPAVQPGTECADPSLCLNSATLTCEPGFCYGFEEKVDLWDETTCEISPASCDCIKAPPLEPGVIGRDSALAVAGGVAYVSAHEDAFGDLLLGTSSDLTTFDWEIVDGIPEGAQPTAGLSGWRDGIIEPGDDVGYYTSIQIGSDGQPRIAYYDATHGTLRFAQRSGDSWTTHAIHDEPGIIAGWYASLALAANDRPIVGFMIAGIRDVDSAWHSQARVARAATDDPQQATDWSDDLVEDVLIPCTGMCSDEEVCLADGWTCAFELDASECSVACTDGQACADLASPTCVDVLDDTGVEDIPWGAGLWMTVEFDDFGLPQAAYHRRVPDAGALHIANFNGVDNWVVTVADGGAGEDVGQHLSMFIDATGLSHLSYVDVQAEDLIYLQWNGAEVARQVVDDGARDDGPHLVGADSSILDDAAGTVRIVYQDQTSVDLWLATRGKDDTWTVEPLAEGDQGFGFYNDLARDETGLYASTFAYDTEAKLAGSVLLYEIQ